MSKKFSFTYSSPTKDERKEIESIRSQYLERTESETKLERLKKLDRKVKEIPLVVALSIGIISTLIFGLGFAMVLEWNLLAWGIVVSVVGAIPMAVNYFIYKKLSIHLKGKYSKEILQLSDELLGKEETEAQ